MSSLTPATTIAGTARTASARHLEPKPLAT